MDIRILDHCHHAPLYTGERDPADVWGDAHDKSYTFFTFAIIYLMDLEGASMSIWEVD